MKDNGNKPNVLYMHSKCHIKSPTWTKIDFDTNQAIIECAECGEEVVRLRLDN